MRYTIPRPWLRYGFRGGQWHIGQPRTRWTLGETYVPCLTPASYSRLIRNLRDGGQTGGVIQTPRGEMRWGDQCEPWVDPFEGRCCCGKEEPCPPGAPWPDEPCRPEAGDCCDGSAHTWQPAQGSRLPDRVDGNRPSDALYGDLTDFPCCSGGSGRVDETGGSE